MTTEQMREELSELIISMTAEQFAEFVQRLPQVLKAGDAA